MKQTKTKRKSCSFRVNKIWLWKNDHSAVDQVYPCLVVLEWRCFVNNKCYCDILSLLWCGDHLFIICSGYMQARCTSAINYAMLIRVVSWLTTTEKKNTPAQAFQLSLSSCPHLACAHKKKKLVWQKTFLDLAWSQTSLLTHNSVSHNLMTYSPSVIFLSYKH